MSSDKKLYNSTFQTYSVNIVSASDYYPFGWAMPERTYSSSNYRFGFNGMEENPEVEGSYTTFYRQLDTRIARWKSIDPIFQPYHSPYNSMDNNPIRYLDFLGDSTIYAVANENEGFVIFRSNDNLENAVVILNSYDEFEKLWLNGVQSRMSGDFNFSEFHSDEFNILGRTLGKNYMVDDMKRLYSDNVGVVATQEGTPEDRLLVDENDRKVRVPPEYSTELIVSNNEVRISSLDVNDETAVWSMNQPADVGLPDPPHIHTHPAANMTLYRRVPTLGTKKGYSNRPITLLDVPPSRADWNKVREYGKSTYSVIVTPTHFWFYNRVNGTDVKVKITY